VTIARDASARIRVGVSFLVGAGVWTATALMVGGKLAPVSGWDGAAIVYVAWMLVSLRGADADQTRRHARSEDPGPLVADVILLSASVVSLAAVAVVLIDASRRSGLDKELLVGLGIASVVLAWAVVHTVYTLRYARLYYGDPPGGIEFNSKEAPAYRDFAYLAFTIGMTFQVSDTSLKTGEFRAAALRHALLSYLFGAVIIATTINLVAGLTS
jgi:uncharacterized membrane protein